MKIALIRRNGFGDLIVSIPLINYLKQQFNKCEITLFVEYRNIELVKYIPNVDKHQVFPTGNKYIGFAKMAVKCRNKFDIVINADWTSMKGVNRLIRFLNAKDKYAYLHKKSYIRHINRGLWLKQLDGDKQHVALHILQVFNQNIDVIPSSLFPKLAIPHYIDSRYQESINSKLKHRDNTLLNLFISISNNRDHSSLSINKYAELLNDLYKVQQFNLIVSYIGSDHSVAIKLENQLNFKSNIVGTSSFDEFMVLLSKIDIFFIGDGGIMHIAAALGKKQLCLFGKTSVQEWQPLSNNKYTRILSNTQHVNLIPKERILGELQHILMNHGNH
jgi:ADP-heptose:LPS heptosyltransferase